MALPETTALALDRQDGVLHATLDRPDAGNALDAGLIDDLVNTFNAVRDDRSVRVVVLRGAGDHFCVGADLNALADFDGDDASARDEATAHSRRFGELLETVDAAPQAVIALADGAALGGGFGLLCVADITIVTTDTRMGMPEARLGVPAAQILPFVVARIGAAETRRLGICGHQLKGGEAARLGIAHDVVDDAEAGEERITAVLEDVLACAPGAIAETKRIVRAARTAEPAALLDAGTETFTDCLTGDEGRDGVRAFFDKRAPYWAQGDGDA